jgi:hypothetical protein
MPTAFREEFPRSRENAANTNAKISTETQFRKAGPLRQPARCDANITMVIYCCMYYGELIIKKVLDYYFAWSEEC